MEEIRIDLALGKCSYGICRICNFKAAKYPALNPNGISNMEPTLSFNTIISFMTNTNLQHYEEKAVFLMWHKCVSLFL